MSVGAAGAAAAAAAQRQREAEEEELMGYSERDLADGWEFKILRSSIAAFGDREKLRTALEEESRAGWVLVEKFDNARIRLKRPASARQFDDKLDPEIDPYRTEYGPGPGAVVAVIVLAITLGVAIFGVVIAFAAR